MSAPASLHRPSATEPPMTRSVTADMPKAESATGPEERYGLVMGRVGGLPADVLDLVGVCTRELLEAHAGVDTQLAELAPALVNVLYALVPVLDDDASLRRAVLAGKRAVHRGAALSWEDATARAVAERLDAVAAEQLRAWQLLTGQRTDLATQLAQSLADDRAAMVERLYATVSRPEFLCSLAVAAPEWIANARPQNQRVLTPRALRTLLLYVSRAAVKTSPFSGLTTIGVCGWDGSGRAVSRVSAVVGHLLVQHLARQDHTAGLLRYRGGTFRPGTPDEPLGLFLRQEGVLAGGVAWRDDRVVEADHAQRWSLGSGDDGEEELTYDELLARCEGAEPAVRARRLLETKLVQPVPPWRREEDPLEVLARLELPGPSPTAEQIGQVRRLGRQTAAASVEQRVQASTAAQDLVRALDGLTPHAEHGLGGLVYEDRETDLALPDLLSEPAICEDLAALSRRIRPYVFRTHVYDLLLEEFVAGFGPGGSCSDPLGFLMRLAVDRDVNRPLAAAEAKDRAHWVRPSPRAWLPVGPTSASPSAGLLVQVAADRAADVSAGKYQLVVNQFVASSGAMATRFTRLLGGDFTRALRQSVVDSRGGLPCRELTLWTECNTAQAECSGLLPPLLVPGEPAAANGLPLHRTVLVHDRNSDTLSLCTRDGEPFALVYTGLTPAHLVPGYLKYLCVLADPWRNGSPDSDAGLTLAAEFTAPEPEVVRLPRVQHGRLVTQRESWLAPRSSWPGLDDDAADDLALALALDHFRREHGMPEEVYVRQLGDRSTASVSATKPLWLAFGSPLSVAVLRQWLLPSASRLRIVEALPARHEYPLRDHDGRRRASEYVVPLWWPAAGQAR